ncbi:MULTISPECIES: esterase/lipase family protein [unclassified Variovorax]|uniref:esterase/lipase family protein n=1 Tax=unclassified Variovorax TaxID=663243 RepID=UPI00088AC069|nr:hypothetical protein [Variovorax sp. CF079]SDE03696.1 PGAP1-like protein [Variovorax sp. CF079]
MANPHAPYHPIIYVRGFAGTQSEIEATVADPFMGFNIGSTKSRRIWDGTMRRYFFESPLVRLKDEIIWRRTATGRERSDQWYDDVYVNGEDLTAPDPDDKTKPLRSDITLPYQSIAILRYYDDASNEFGDGQPHPITHFAQNLGELILRMRTLVCRKNGKHPILGDPLDNGVEEKDFKIYLVAHSMGGLVCRAFLQNDTLGTQEARDAVDKLFTYATPHNGIDLRVVRNVPGWGALGDATNFNRDTMKSYLKLAPTATDVSELTHFPAERVFNLVGSNPADYLALQGLSSWAVGDASDGLVRMDNATTFGMVGPEEGPRLRVDSPRAFVFRSHSGHYGIVNSEEGYQNLTRFLFGSVRTDGILDIEEVALPEEVEAKRKSGHAVRASYRFEIVATLRRSQWQLHRRVVRENSAIQRKFDDLFPDQGPGIARKAAQAASPHLFSIFLDPTRASPDLGNSIAFAFDLNVLVPDYEVDGVLWLNKHFEGGFLYRDQILVEAVPDPAAAGGWRLQYGFQSQTPNVAAIPAPVSPQAGALTFKIPVVSPPGTTPGIKAQLRIEMRTWA